MWHSSQPINFGGIVIYVLLNTTTYSYKERESKL